MRKSEKVNVWGYKLPLCKVVLKITRNDTCQSLQHNPDVFLTPSLMCVLRLTTSYQQPKFRCYQCLFGVIIGHGHPGVRAWEVDGRSQQYLTSWKKGLQKIGCVLQLPFLLGTNVSGCRALQKALRVASTQFFGPSHTIPQHLFMPVSVLHTMLTVMAQTQSLPPKAHHRGKNKQQQNMIQCPRARIQDIYEVLLEQRRAWDGWLRTVLQREKFWWTSAFNASWHCSYFLFSSSCSPLPWLSSLLLLTF